MTEIRILTAKNPHAHDIFHHGKDVENRSTNIAGSYRGPVLIHSALKFDRNAYADPYTTYEFGVILGVVDLVGAHQRYRYRESDLLESEPCSPWAKEGWHLVLENPRLLPEPVPWKGRLGLTTLETTCWVCQGKGDLPPHIARYRSICHQCNGSGETVRGVEALL